MIIDLKNLKFKFLKKKIKDAMSEGPTTAFPRLRKLHQFNKKMR